MKTKILIKQSSLFTLYTLFTLFTFSATAQKNTYGIKAGVHYNSIIYSGNGLNISGNNIGFHAGGLLQHTLSKKIFFQPQFILSLRGGNYNDLGSKTKTNLFYAELPLNILYIHHKFFAGAGPAFLLGLTGKIKGNGTNVNAYNDEASFLQLKRFEAGYNILAGYQLKNNYFISANFTGGFTNIYKIDPARVKAGTSVLAVSAGYMFERKK